LARWEPLPLPVSTKDSRVKKNTEKNEVEYPAELSFGLPTFVENPHLGNVLLNPNHIVVADRMLHIAGQQPGRQVDKSGCRQVAGSTISQFRPPFLAPF